MTPNDPIRLVDQTGALSALVKAISDIPALALDTEFHAERRYDPELMVVQLGAEDGRTWVIDPLAVSLNPLAAALANKQIVVHSGSQDTRLLHRDCEISWPDTFDVQIAAGMVGFGHPVRLGDLVAEFLGLPLDKGATLSNWAARPLGTAQLSYAAADVQVLFPLMRALETQLKEAGRLHWAIAESQAMAEQARAPHCVDHHWARWEIAPRLHPDTHRVLTALYEWRDQQGRNKNQPAHFMLSDGLCLDIARRRPSSLSTLAENRRIPQGLIRRMGAEILGAVAWALDNPVQLPPISTMAQQRKAKALLLWAEALSAGLGVARSLLISEPLAHQIARDGVTALNGWRSEAIGEPLQRFIDGKAGIFLSDDGPVVR